MGKSTEIVNAIMDRIFERTGDSIAVRLPDSTPVKRMTRSRVQRDITDIVETMLSCTTTKIEADEPARQAAVNVKKDRERRTLEDQIAFWNSRIEVECLNLSAFNRLVSAFQMESFHVRDIPPSMIADARMGHFLSVNRLEIMEETRNRLVKRLEVLG